MTTHSRSRNNLPSPGDIIEAKEEVLASNNDREQQDCDLYLMVCDFYLEKYICMEV